MRVTLCINLYMKGMVIGTIPANKSACACSDPQEKTAKYELQYYCVQNTYASMDTKVLLFCLYSDHIQNAIVVAGVLAQSLVKTTPLRECPIVFFTQACDYICRGLDCISATLTYRGQVLALPNTLLTDIILCAWLKPHPSKLSL